MAQTGTAGLPKILQTLNSPGSRQGFALIIAAAAVVALLAGAWLWGQTPDYRVLFAGVSDRDGGEIVASLNQMNVQYKFTEGGGAILVPADRVHEARLRLASEGLPRGSMVGFELMENTRLGTSQFLEQVNYQRALEGELSRSIQSLAAVQSARVHLAIPKPTVFLRETQKPSASVLLSLFPGRSLEPGQVNAIAHLVSSSIANLPLQNVAVVDQTGALLSSNSGTPDDGLDSGQLRYVKELERGLANRIEAILEPMVGSANVRAQVAADVDFSRVEHAEELFRPNQEGNAAIRSLQSSEATNGNQGPGNAGVPGAYSNQPPAPAAAPITGIVQPENAFAASSAAASTQKDSAIRYEVDKTVRHIRQSVGSVQRLSVAVIVNHRTGPGVEGRPSYLPRSDAEMKQIEDLVREAMGYNEARGDSVTVAHAPFAKEAPAALVPVPFWQQPGFWIIAREIGKHLLIALVVMLVFFKVIRPLFSSLLAAPVSAQLAAPETDLMPEGPAASLPRQQVQYERTLTSARQLAQQDPKLVANIVKTWVSGDER